MYMYEKKPNVVNKNGTGRWVVVINSFMSDEEEWKLECYGMRAWVWV